MVLEGLEDTSYLRLVPETECHKYLMLIEGNGIAEQLVVVLKEIFVFGLGLTAENILVVGAFGDIELGGILGCDYHKTTHRKTFHHLMVLCALHGLVRSADRGWGILSHGEV